MASTAVAREPEPEPEPEIVATSLIHIPLNQHNSETTIIATIARMNPPTPGHLLLVSRMILEAATAGLTQITIILSHSQDGDENPLDCWTKRDVFLYTSVNRLRQHLIAQYPDLAAAINKVNIAIICMNDPFQEEVPEIASNKTPILKAIEYVLYRFYMYPREGITFKLFVGDDRDYSKFLGPSLAGMPRAAVGFQQITLERTDMSYFKTISQDCSRLATLNIASVPQTAMSASFVRNLVKCGFYEKFQQVMQQAFLDPGQVLELYNLLSDALVPGRAGGASSPGKRKRTTKKRRVTKKRKQLQKTTRIRKYKK